MVKAISRVGATVRAAGLCLFLAGTFWHPSVRPSQAAGDPNWGGYTGPSINTPVQIDPHDRLIASLKAEFLRDVPPGTLPSADSRARFVYTNPSAHYNPSVTSVPQAEMLSLALDQRMMGYTDPLNPGVWNPTPRDEAKVINQNLTAHNYGWFYLFGNGSGFDDIYGDHLGYWTQTEVNNDTVFDIQEQGVPSILDLDARAISPGWAADYAPPHGPVNHIVALNGYNPGTPGTSFPTPSVELFDSASPADGSNLIPSSDNPPGFRSKPISTIANDPYLGSVGFYDQIW